MKASQAFLAISLLSMSFSEHAWAKKSSTVFEISTGCCFGVYNWMVMPKALSVVPKNSIVSVILSQTWLEEPDDCLKYAATENEKKECPPSRKGLNVELEEVDLASGINRVIDAKKVFNDYGSHEYRIIPNNLLTGNRIYEIWARSPRGTKNAYLLSVFRTNNEIDNSKPEWVPSGSASVTGGSSKGIKVDLASKAKDSYQTIWAIWLSDFGKPANLNEATTVSIPIIDNDLPSITLNTSACGQPTLRVLRNRKKARMTIGIMDIAGNRGNTTAWDIDVDKSFTTLVK